MLELFNRGGPVMWPLLALSIICLAAVLERFWFALRLFSNRDEAGINRTLALIEAGKLQEATSILEKSSDYVARVLAAGLSHWKESESIELLSSVLLQQANVELRAFQRGLVVLDTSITIAPLLGLLGTVTGMIRSFGMLGGQELSTPAVITGGIAEALIATACGLGIAILAVLPFNYLNARIEEAKHAIEDAGTRLELILAAQKERRSIGNEN